MTTWSFSSLKTFTQCPKKYYHLKVAKDVKDAPNEASLYGEQAHEAAERYIAEGEELPKQFEFLRPILDSLNAIPGDKYCEVKMGLAESEDGYVPCEFFGQGVWWRGIADLLIINGGTAYSVDYKTGKNTRYADTTQLDIIAAATFIKFPEVQKIKSALVYVVSNEFIKVTHTRPLTNSYIATFYPALDKRIRAVPRHRRAEEETRCTKRSTQDYGKSRQGSQG